MRIYVFTHVYAGWDTYVVLAENEAEARAKLHGKIVDQISRGEILASSGVPEYVFNRLSVEEFDPADVVVIESNE